MLTDIGNHLDEDFSLNFACCGLGDGEDFGDFQALFVSILSQEFLLGWQGVACFFLFFTAYSAEYGSFHKFFVQHRT